MIKIKRNGSITTGNSIKYLIENNFPDNIYAHETYFHYNIADIRNSAIVAI